MLGTSGVGHLANQLPRGSQRGWSESVTGSLACVEGFSGRCTLLGRPVNISFATPEKEWRKVGFSELL
jgi:hypothetical protein